jgi:hypothetical protein
VRIIETNEKSCYDVMRAFCHVTSSAMYCTMSSGVFAAFISSLADIHKHYNRSTLLELTSMLSYHTTLGHKLCRLASLTLNLTSPPPVTQGMIKAVFTPQNRMVYLELSFDVMSFMQQLRRASGKQDFQVEITACVFRHLQ